MTTSEIRKALNTEFKLAIVKYLIEQINADNFRSRSCQKQLNLLRYNLEMLTFKCDTSKGIILVQKRNESVKNLLRKM